MKLTFRGNAYDIPAPIPFGSASTNQSKIKVIYRGHRYDYTPPLECSEVVESGRQLVTLIYRGSTYEHTTQSSKPYQQPRAINCRYQIPGEGLNAR